MCDFSEREREVMEILWKDNRELTVFELAGLEDGTYWLHVGDKYSRKLSSEELNDITHDSLPIIKETKELECLQ